MISFSPSARNGFWMFLFYSDYYSDSEAEAAPAVSAVPAGSDPPAFPDLPFLDLFLLDGFPSLLISLLQRHRISLHLPVPFMRRELFLQIGPHIARLLEQCRCTCHTLFSSLGARRPFLFLHVLQGHVGSSVSHWLSDSPLPL